MESSVFYELEALRLVTRQLANTAKLFLSKICSRHSVRNSLLVPTEGLESQYLRASTSRPLSMPSKQKPLPLLERRFT